MLYWIIYPIGSMPRCISFSQLMPWLFLPLCNPNMNPMICTLGRSSRLVKMIASVVFNAHSSFPLLMALAEKIRIHIKTESTILVNRDSTQKEHVLIANWNSDKDFMWRLLRFTIQCWHLLLTCRWAKLPQGAVKRERDYHSWAEYAPQRHKDIDNDKDIDKDKHRQIQHQRQTR